MSTQYTRFTKSSEEVDQDWSHQITQILEDGIQGEDIQEKLVGHLLEADPEITAILQDSRDGDSARDLLYRYLNRVERRLYRANTSISSLVRAAIEERLRIFRNVIAPVNEITAGFSALDHLWFIANDRLELADEEVKPGFLLEFIYLIHGIHGWFQTNQLSEMMDIQYDRLMVLEGREAALERSGILDRFGETLREFLDRYPSGLDDSIAAKRRSNKDRILAYFNGTQEDWTHWKWHIRHIITDPDVLSDLVAIPSDIKASISRAIEHQLPFGITPYYLSLMDSMSDQEYDHAIRAQVLPPPSYVNTMTASAGIRELSFDFMGEHDTSPIDLITRRYPKIAILKPFNTCAQICVYCQRNWEINQCMAPHSMAEKSMLDDAIDWFSEHPAISDVLVTGGDPMLMSDKALEYILSRLSEIDHVKRIRIGSRTPVVLPSRWTESVLDVISRYIEPGKREIVLVTHVEHSTEITPELAEAVSRIRRRGISVYNQLVFTMENSRRFETAKLRMDLRSIGIDPYYTFNTKGKEETLDYQVPIARILQERKEEARLLPGLDRTDEPVFNVPRLGKNNLRAIQDHRLIMIKADGGRVYDFHPWEEKFADISTYPYTDKPIYDYLKELARRSVDIQEYNSIWYYY
jgi:lysine 2,3-aminomutase